MFHPPHFPPRRRRETLRGGTTPRMLATAPAPALHLAFSAECNPVRLPTLQLHHLNLRDTNARFIADHSVVE